MKKLRSVLLTCFSLCCSLVISAQSDTMNSPADETVPKELMAYLEEASQGKFSGTVLIARKGTPILTKGFGQADREQHISNNAETVYDIGSLTKQFTAAAILKLEMQGRLLVTDPVSKYLPEFRTVQKDRTLHQLLTHTAGFPGAMGGDYDAISESDFIDLAIDRADWSKDDPSYEYSNVGYSLLAIIIERVSGMDYEAFLSKYLFQPADLKNTGYLLPDWQDDMLATGYKKKKIWGKPNDKNWSEKGPYLHLKGNGGILSTVEDLYRWKQVLETDKILSSEARAKYFEAQVPEEAGGNTFYGYGWVIIPHEKMGTIITHNGGNGIFFADFWNFRDSDDTVIVLSNASNRYTEELALSLYRML